MQQSSPQTFQEGATPSAKLIGTATKPSVPPPAPGTARPSPLPHKSTLGPSGTPPTPSLASSPALPPRQKWWSSKGARRVGVGLVVLLVVGGLLMWASSKWPKNSLTATSSTTSTAAAADGAWIATRTSNGQGFNANGTLDGAVTVQAPVPTNAMFLQMGGWYWQLGSSSANSSLTVSLTQLQSEATLFIRSASNGTLVDAKTQTYILAVQLSAEQQQPVVCAVPITSMTIATGSSINMQPTTAANTQPICFFFWQGSFDLGYTAVFGLGVAPAAAQLVTIEPPPPPLLPETTSATGTTVAAAAAATNNPTALLLVKTLPAAFSSPANPAAWSSNQNIPFMYSMQAVRPPRATPQSFAGLTYAFANQSNELTNTVLAPGTYIAWFDEIVDPPPSMTSGAVGRGLLLMPGYVYMRQQAASLSVATGAYLCLPSVRRVALTTTGTLVMLDVNNAVLWHSGSHLPPTAGVMVAGMQSLQIRTTGANTTVLWQLDGGDNNPVRGSECPT